METSYPQALAEFGELAPQAVGSGAIASQNSIREAQGVCFASGRRRLLFVEHQAGWRIVTQRADGMVIDAGCWRKDDDERLAAALVERSRLLFEADEEQQQAADAEQQAAGAKQQAADDEKKQKPFAGRRHPMRPLGELMPKTRDGQQQPVVAAGANDKTKKPVEPVIKTSEEQDAEDSRPENITRQPGNIPPPEDQPRYPASFGLSMGESAMLGDGALLAERRRIAAMERDGRAQVADCAGLARWMRPGMQVVVLGADRASCTLRVLDEASGLQTAVSSLLLAPVFG